MKSGYQNEFDFINYLNRRKYSETNILIRNFLKELFPYIKEDDLIVAYKYGRYAKVDMVIEVKGIKKGVSIKSGTRNSVHLEPIKKFILYLEKLKFEEKDKLLRYLYSDGTNNNTGKLRQSSSEYKMENSEDIMLLNEKLNILKKELIVRFLVKTDINYKINVDAFVIGDVNNFLWATKEEVVDYLVKIDKESSGVHVGELFIQNWNKNLKYNLKYEWCRNYIQVKWYSMYDDLMQIKSNRDN